MTLQILATLVLIYAYAKVINSYGEMVEQTDRRSAIAAQGFFLAGFWAILVLIWK